MTRFTFIRLSGWGMIFGALALLLTFVTEAQIQTSVHRFFGALPTLFGTAPSQTTVNQVWGARFLVAIILIAFGLVGLLARYGERAGNAAKLALDVGVLGGAAGVVSNLLWVTGYEQGRALMNFSITVMFVGLFVFGLIALMVKPLPRGNGLPMLAGFWWPAIWINAYMRQALGYLGLDVPFWVSFTIFSLMSFFLAWLGYVLQSDASPEPVLA